MCDIETIDGIDQIQAVENWIKQQPQIDIETRHHFAGGVYEREILVPEGALITGKIHLHEHLAKLVSGTMTIYSEESGGTFTGPRTFVSKPGAKRIGYAHTDCVFSTFHATELTDPEELEKILVVETKDQYLEHMKLIEVKQ